MEDEKFPKYELVKDYDKFTQLLKDWQSEYSKERPEHISQEVVEFFDLALSVPVNNLKVTIQPTIHEDLYKIRVIQTKAKAWQQIDKSKRKISIAKLLKTSCREVKP